MITRYLRYSGKSTNFDVAVRRFSVTTVEVDTTVQATSTGPIATTQTLDIVDPSIKEKWPVYRVCR